MLTRLERCLLVLAFWPVWVWYLYRTLDRSDEPWQILAVSGLLFYLFRSSHEDGSKDRLLPVSRKPAIIGLLLYILGYNSLPAIGRAAIAILTVWFSAVPVRRLPAGGFFLLMLCLPILPSLDFLLNYPLRRLTAIFALPLLECAGFHVGVTGSSFSWNGQLVSIDGPCSGVRMLYTVLLVTALLSTFLNLPLRKTLALFSLGFLSVLLGNVLRSSALFFVEAKPFQAEIFSKFEPFFHQGAGVVMFSLSMLVVLAAAKHMSQQKAVW